MVLVTTVKQGLHKKISQHLCAAGIDRYFHRLGPKYYTTCELVLGLALREKYRLSYRETSLFLDEYYDFCPHWTTLQKAAKRLPSWLWHRVLGSTAQIESLLAAIDATGYARTNPSEHYLKRIDGTRPKVPVKLSAMIDIDSRKILSARVRLRPAGDVKDVHGLIKRAHKPPWSVVMDKGYDSEPLHKWLDTHGVWSIAPTRKGCQNGIHRRQLRDHFPQNEYGQRNVIEAIFKSIKSKYGSHVRGRTARTVRAELMIRLILHNIRAILQQLFLQTLSDQYI